MTKYYINQYCHYFKSDIDLDLTLLNEHVSIHETINDMESELIDTGLHRDEIGEPFTLDSDHYNDDRGFPCDFKGTPEAFLNDFII